MTSEALSIWTLYDSPGDAPGMFVVRRFEVLAGGTVVATLDAHYSRQAEPLRQRMRQLGLTRILRDENDDRHVVESWL